MKEAESWCIQIIVQKITEEEKNVLRNPTVVLAFCVKRPMFWLGQHDCNSISEMWFDALFVKVLFAKLILVFPYQSHSPFRSYTEKIGIIHTLNY